MDSGHYQFVALYAIICAVFTVFIDQTWPDWSKIKIAFWCGVAAPLLGLLMGTVLIVLWFFQSRAPGDVDHHAMAIIGPMIIVLLSLFTGLLGFLVSGLVLLVRRWPE